MKKNTYSHSLFAKSHRTATSGWQRGPNFSGDTVGITGAGFKTSDFVKETLLPQTELWICSISLPLSVVVVVLLMDTVELSIHTDRLRIVYTYIYVEV